jgi:hypothetical protein
MENTSNENSVNESSVKDDAVTRMIVQKVTIDDLVHLVALKITPRLERLEERIINLEILITDSKLVNSDEKDKIKIAIEGFLESLRFTLEGK